MSLGLTVLISIFLLGLGFIISRLRVPANLKQIPSPSAIQWIKSMLDTRPVDVKIHEITSETINSSKIQRVWRFGKWGVLVSSPQAAKMMFTDTVTFPKVLPSEKTPASLFSRFMGINLVFSNHGVWKRHRRVLNPPFKKQFQVEIFSDCVKQFFDVVDGNFNRTEIDVFKYMQRITMDALGKGIMGVEFNSVVEDSVPFINAYNKIMKNAFAPQYFIIPFLDASWNPFRKDSFDTLKQLETHFQEILDSKKEVLLKGSIEEKDHSSADLLTLMLQAGQSEDVNFTDKEIRDNVMIFLLAGHDTTAFAMSGALHFLAQNSEIQSKARAEILRVMELKDYKNSSPEACPVPTIEQTKDMDYLMAIMKETMRLYPSVSRLPTRITSQDVVIDGHKIPKNTEVILDIYSMHRDPDNFNRSTEFIPERFFKDSEFSKLDDQKMDLTAWTPFGGGTRSCIGMNFSLLEQKVVLAMILLRYKVSYPESYPESNGAPMRLASVNLLTPTNLKLNFELIV